MFVVMLVGNPLEASRFLDNLQDQHSQILWLVDTPIIYENTDLFVSCGGLPYPPKDSRSITWSGDDAETIERVYKSLFPATGVARATPAGLS
jgi:hypothetical protein